MFKTQFVYWAILQLDAIEYYYTFYECILVHNLCTNLNEFFIEIRIRIIYILFSFYDSVLDVKYVFLTSYMI